MKIIWSEKASKPSWLHTSYKLAAAKTYKKLNFHTISIYQFILLIQQKYVINLWYIQAYFPWAYSAVPHSSGVTVTTIWVVQETGYLHTVTAFQWDDSRLLQIQSVPSGFQSLFHHSSTFTYKHLFHQWNIYLYNHL